MRCEQAPELKADPASGHVIERHLVSTSSLPLPIQIPNFFQFLKSAIICIGRKKP
jgi:hypothetical protein